MAFTSSEEAEKYNKQNRELIKHSTTEKNI